MKLLVAVLFGLCCGGLIWAGAQTLFTTACPSSDALTSGLRRLAERYVLTPRWPLLERYIIHVTPLLEELRGGLPLDLPLFLSLHGLSAVVMGGLGVVSFGSSFLWVSPVSLLGGGSLPYLWLRHRQSQRHRQLRKALPEALDLVALVMEGGLDLTAGLQLYVQRGAPGPLRDLLAEVLHQTQMGRSRAEALTHLARQTSFAPLCDVAYSLVQALSLGTSLTPLLHEEAASLRVKRMQIAEKKAAEAPLKILFPLVVFIFPTIFLVLFGPVAILFMRGGLW